MNAGKLKPERVEAFKQLLELMDVYKRKNQYEQNDGKSAEGWLSFVLIGDDDIKFQVKDKRWEKKAE